MVEATLLSMFVAVLAITCLCSYCSVGKPSRLKNDPDYVPFTFSTTSSSVNKQKLLHCERLIKRHENQNHASTLQNNTVIMQREESSELTEETRESIEGLSHEIEVLNDPIENNFEEEQ